MNETTIADLRERTQRLNELVQSSDERMKSLGWVRSSDITGVKIRPGPTGWVVAIGFCAFGLGVLAFGVAGVIAAIGGL